MTIIDRFLAWISSETRLMTADNWEREDMRVAPSHAPLTSEDPRCAETLRYINRAWEGE